MRICGGGIRAVFYAVSQSTVNLNLTTAADSFPTHNTAQPQRSMMKTERIPPVALGLVERRIRVRYRSRPLGCRWHAGVAAGRNLQRESGPARTGGPATSRQIPPDTFPPAGVRWRCACACWCLDNRMPWQGTSYAAGARGRCCANGCHSSYRTQRARLEGGKPGDTGCDRVKRGRAADTPWCVCASYQR